MAEERLEEIRQARLAKRQAVLDAGRSPYPAEAVRSHTMGEVAADFDSLAEQQETVTVNGRLTALRSHGGVVFADLADSSGSLQLQINKDDVPQEIFDRLELLDIGDFIQAAGKLITTSRGAQTLLVAEWHMLAKGIRPLPTAQFGLKDHEKRFRNRELDLLLNTQAREVLETRERVITWLRHYFKGQGYLEFETPILQTTAGGAAARPFSTHHNALDMPLHLRIAAELPLKRLLVAGFEKVFEIERRFRNEGVDRQHNPEFTMLEAQWAYADYEDLMNAMEEMLEQLCQELFATTDIVWQEQTLSFARPFKRVRYVDLVSTELGVDILAEKDLAVYLRLLEKHQLDVPETKNYYQLVDELYKELIRPTLIQPTLLYDYPAEMAPLAKRSATDPRVAEKFQLLIAGLEVNNSYTEQNDPVLQRQLMEEQQTQRDAGDDEAQGIDEEYLRAMEYGMPPNVGWGIGIDRLTMLLTDSASIRDTIAFPLMRPEND